MFQIVRTFKHRDISGQKPFAETTKQPQEVAQACPNAFHRVVVDFPNPITMIIARPFPLSRSMADPLMDTTRCRESVIGRPFISVESGIRPGMLFNQWL